MDQIRVRMNENGRIVIPANIRKALGIQAGDEVILQVDEHEIRLTTMKQRLAHAQKIVSKYIAPGTRLSDELIADRRAEAKREHE